jgi:DNA-binding NtrC family response regulator
MKERSSAAPADVSVLVIDDEEYLLTTCGQILGNEGYEVMTARSGRQGLELVRRQHPDIVFSDLRLPDTDGMAVLKEVRTVSPETLIIMMTGFATVDSSVEAIREGAYDYIPKPFTATQLRILMGRAAQQVTLARDNARLRDALKREYGFENIVGTSDALRQVFSLISRVAPTDASVFISGESGTGKELVARAIHAHSRRSQRAFMAVNCAALPDNLLESELFGHEKGSFTGADSRRKGLIELAEGGTFFLDEISEMSMELQAKLLRVVQERKIRRVGGEGEIDVDVRWVSATNRDPEEAVAEGVLRQDLFYRLNVVPIHIPPLRERPEDVLPLAEHFLAKYSEQYGRPGLRLAPEAIDVLRDHAWPGNVRELQNAIERAVSLGMSDGLIEPDDLPPELRRPRSNSQTWASIDPDQPFHDAKNAVVEAFERQYLRALLDRNAGNISKAARTAGIDRKTIHRMLARYDMDADKRTDAGD